MTNDITGNYLYARDNGWLILHQNEFKDCGFILYRVVAPTPEHPIGIKYVTGTATEPTLYSKCFAKIYTREEIDRAVSNILTFALIFGFVLKVGYVVPNDYPED